MAKIPTIGRIVHYTLTATEATMIATRRGRLPSHGEFAGNNLAEGQTFPAIIVATNGFEPQSSVNLRVWLDGIDDYWATSVSAGAGPGFYHFPHVGAEAPHETLAPRKIADLA